MKPITDDIILTLIERAERRQKASSPANDAKPLTRPLADVVTPEGGRVISFDFMRRRKRARRTVTGLFLYAPRARGAS